MQVDLDEYKNDKLTAAIQTEMQGLTGARTVPRVFIGGRFFGDGSETIQGARTGRLITALDEAGVSTKDA